MLEEEARKLNLPGSDVFMKTHLAYKDELNRDALIVQLNSEAYKAFIDTVIIGQYPLIRKEGEALMNGVKMVPPTLYRRIEYINLENFKIATGFELHLKACLLANDIVIHLINKNPLFKALRDKQQKNKPVYIHEVLNIEGFYFNGNLNVLRGLRDKSLGFDDILKPNYSQNLGKNQDLLNVIGDYHNLRNQIHLPGDDIEAPHLNQYAGDSLMKLLVTFINEDIVECNHKLVDKWKLHPAGKLAHLEYFKTK